MVMGKDPKNLLDIKYICKERKIKMFIFLCDSSEQLMAVCLSLICW